MRTNLDAFSRKYSNQTPIPGEGTKRELETNMELNLLVKIAMFLTFFCQGLYSSVPVVSYLYIKDYNTHAVITSFQAMCAGGYIISIIGSIIWGRYLPRQHFPIFFSVTLIFLCGSTAAVPYAQNFKDKLILSGFSGVLNGGLDSVTHVYSLNIWEQSLDPTFQTFYFGRSIGTVLAPAIIMEYMRIHSNNTYKFELMKEDGRLSTYPYIVMSQFHLWGTAAWLIIYGLTSCGHYTFPVSDKTALLKAPCRRLVVFAVLMTSVLAFISASVEIGYEQVLAHISYEKVQNFDFYVIHPFHIFNLCGLAGRACAIFLAYKFSPFLILMGGTLIFIVSGLIEFVFTYTRGTGAVFVDGLVNFGSSVLLPSSLSFHRMHILINFTRMAGILFGKGAAGLIMPHSLEKLLHLGKRFIPYMVIVFSFVYLIIVVVQYAMFCKKPRRQPGNRPRSRVDSEIEDVWNFIQLYSNTTSKTDEGSGSERSDQGSNSSNRDEKQTDVVESFAQLQKNISEINKSARRAIQSTQFSLK